MKKSVAKKYDKLLLFLASPTNPHFTIKSLAEWEGKFGLNYQELKTAISIFNADGFLSQIEIEGFPKLGTGLYEISNKGVKFIKVQGGYSKNRRHVYYQNKNLWFTFIRHWVWFLGFLISLILNAYFIFKLYINW